MSKKTSASAKARYSIYEASGTAAKNKAAKIARHLKKHPEDAQSASRAKSTCSGKSHEKRTQLECQIRRSINTGAFGNK